MDIGHAPKHLPRREGRGQYYKRPGPLPARARPGGPDVLKEEEGNGHYSGRRGNCLNELELGCC